MEQLISSPNSSWLLRYCRFSMTPKFSKFSSRPDSWWRTYAVQFRLLKKSVLLLSGNSLEIGDRFQSFFLRSIMLFTVLMLLQVGTPNSAFILLIWKLASTGILAARENLKGGYLHRGVYGIMLWYGWEWWEGSWKLLVPYVWQFVAITLYWTCSSWTLPWIFLLNAIWRKIVFYSCSSRMLT